VGLVAKLVWRVKLVVELRPGVMTETEVARIERDEQAGLADLGLRLAETKWLTAALQAEIVPEMRWNRTTVQPFLDVRTAVLKQRLEDAFRYRYPGFRSANDDQARSAAA
jgi:hypothetical protein